MPYSTKGMFALLRDLMAHDVRAPARSATVAAVAPVSTGQGWVNSVSFDLATASGQAHWSSATGSPMLAERLPALRAELDRGLAPDGD